MAEITISNLGQIGALPDRAGYILPPNAFTKLLNARTTREGIESFMGSNYADFFDTSTVLGFGGILGEILAKTVSGVNYWYYGDTISIKVTDGANITDITGSFGGIGANPAPPTVGGWNLTMLNGVPIFNYIGLESPHYGSATNPTAVTNALPNWPPAHLSTMSCKSLRAYLQYLVAVNVTEDGVEYPAMVRWSDFADPGSVPTGSDAWDETSATSQAGRVVLSDTPGHCVDCVPLGSTNIIYKSDSMYQMEFVGPPFIFRFNKIPGGVGLLTRSGVVETPHGHAFFARDDLMLFNGSQAPVSLGEGRVQRTVFAEIDPDTFDNCFAVYNPEYDEVWFCYPDGNQNPSFQGCNKAAIYNFHLNTWQFRELPECTGGGLGLVTPQGTADTWDGGPDVTWDDGPDNLWDSSTEPPRRRLVMGSIWTDFLHVFDYQWQEAQPLDGNGDPVYKNLAGELENTNLALDGQTQGRQPIANPRQRIMVNRIWLLGEPAIANSSPTIQVDIYSKETTNGANLLQASGSFTFTSGADNQIPLIAEGRYLSMRLFNPQPDADVVSFRLSSFIVELLPTGLF